jgi:threonine/homoserine/homoserine lactone efflux protein
MELWVLAGVPATSFIVALSGALMPGPLLTVTVGEAARRGFWAGPLIIVGHALLELALVILLLVGVGAWLHRPAVLGLVGVLGAGMLGWMGLALMRASRHSRLEFDPQADTGLHPILAGVLLSLANPYWLLWWVTIGLGYVMFAAQYGSMWATSWPISSGTAWCPARWPRAGASSPTGSTRVFWPAAASSWWVSAATSVFKE